MYAPTHRRGGIHHIIRIAHYINCGLAVSVIAFISQTLYAGFVR